MKDASKALERIKITFIKQIKQNTAVVVTEELAIEIRKPKARLYSIPNGKTIDKYILMSFTALLISYYSPHGDCPGN